jgi:hypothetical protein
MLATVLNLSTLQDKHNIHTLLVEMQVTCRETGRKMSLFSKWWHLSLKLEQINYIFSDYILTLENTEGATEIGHSRETGNLGYTT